MKLRSQIIIKLAARQWGTAGFEGQGSCLTLFDRLSTLFALENVHIGPSGPAIDILAGKEGPI